ncbi:hypothetical protein C8J55DRAFT_285334 [Lentinula edodes]|uniref:F-box domain-containing protein n=1 Tax=Lentinula lateritia TaxID=40482 RepID=A0A9W8ZRN4_9AGAR|nr:hypothetical protein C8J55DRAFT_285334 [Lentinula edodes]
MSTSMSESTLGDFSTLPLEVLEEIIKQLSPVALDSLSRSCKMFRVLTEAFVAHWHTFDHAVGRFFTGDGHIREFQDLMKVTGLLVSGEAALDFFVHATTATDLHALSNILQCLIVGDWLLTHGYLFAPKDFHLDSFQDDIARFQGLNPIDTTIQQEDDEDIRDLHRECIVHSWLFTKGSMTITLSATSGPPIEGIFSCHSTGEMNILSHEAAYCLFPLMTLVQNRTMLIRLQSPMERSENLAIRKQTNRGLEVVHRPSALLCANITSSLSFLSTRHIGDEHCYIVPFDNTADITRRPDFLECHSWSMAYTRRYNLFLTKIFKPTTPTPAFIVSPEDKALIMARFAVIENLVSDGLLAVEVAVLAIQQFIRDWRRQRTRGNSKAFAHFGTIVTALNGSYGPIIIPACIAQELFEFVITVHAHFRQVSMLEPVHKLRTRKSSAEVNIVFDVSGAMLNLNWRTLKEWAVAFKQYNILINIRRMHS